MKICEINSVFIQLSYIACTRIMKTFQTTFHDSQYQKFQNTTYHPRHETPQYLLIIKYILSLNRNINETINNEVRHTLSKRYCLSWCPCLEVFTLFAFLTASVQRSKHFYFDLFFLKLCFYKSWLQLKGNYRLFHMNI